MSSRKKYGRCHQTVNEALPLIVNIENNIDRAQRADRLAEATGVPREFIQRELFRLLDDDASAAEEERKAIVSQMVKAVQQNPSSANLIIANAQTKLESVGGSRIGYDAAARLKVLDQAFEKMDDATDMFELVTGYPIFDGLMGGIPKEGAMVSIPGAPHHGKSIFLDNLIVGMLEHNSNAQIFLHHVDDATMLRLPRLMGAMTGISSRDIQKAGASMALYGPEFEEKLRKAQAKIREWVRDERLIMADQASLTNDLAAHERWIRDIRRAHPKSHMIAVGDNFHLFDMPGMEPGEGKMREMSKFIANLPVKHGITSMFTMELPKEFLRPGVRPKYTDSKGSGGIAFDSKVNMGIYQDLQSQGNDSDMVWTSLDQMEEVVDPSRAPGMAPKRLPIVEVIVDKNKVTGRKKTIFFELEPLSGKMTECTPVQQSALQLRLDTAAANRKKQYQGGGNNRHF